MATNIIFITNIINMPTELTNTVLKVAEISAKIWWQDFTFWGMVATSLSAWLMWRSVGKMGDQIKISQESVEEMRRQTNMNLVIDLYTQLQEHRGIERKSDRELQKSAILLGNLCMRASNLYYYTITSKKSKDFFVIYASPLNYILMSIKNTTSTAIIQFILKSFAIVKTMALKSQKY